MASRAYTRFFYIKFDLVFDPTWPISHLSKISARQTFWPNFMIIRLKMWPLESTPGFHTIWPSDLVFDPTWPNFELKMWPLERTQGFSKIWLNFWPNIPNFKLVPDFIKTNILTKFHDYGTEYVAFRAYTRQKVDDGWGHSTMTIAHSEHFMLRWAKNGPNAIKPATKVLLTELLGICT